MARAYTRRMARRRPNIDRVTLIVLIAFVLIACVTAVLAVNWMRGALGSRPERGSGGPEVVSSEGQQPVTGLDRLPDNVDAPKGPLQRENDPTPAAWDENNPVNILVMGLDYREWEDGTDIPRTDTMILFTVHPKNKTAGMLSIPRDLWVNVPGIGENKINTAYRWGEVYQTPGGGPGLAMQTVSEFLDVPIHYYALVDFNSFVGFIDKMGGLDMHIREEIVVDPIGPGNTVTLQPGVQTLDGATALAYARNRHTGDGDFDRSRRQQEVIMAVRDQVLTFNMLPKMITKAPALYQEIASGLRTNLTLDQMVRLGMLAGQIDEAQIKRGVIAAPDQVEITFSYDGQSILLPYPDQIRALRDQVLSSDGPVPGRATEPPQQAAASPSGEAPQPAEPTPSSDPLVMMQEENARILLKNGTMTEGLASHTGEMLRSQGLNIVGEENADEQTEHTIIYNYSGKPYTVRYLVQALNVPDSRIINRYDSSATVDVEVILGSDWASQQQ